MGGDADFADYAHARWPELVAALEAEGLEPDDARLVVAEVLLQRRRGWQRLARDEDVDAVVWDDLRRRTHLGLRPGQRARLDDATPRPSEPDPLEPWLTRAAERRAGRRRRSARRTVAVIVLGCLVLAGLAWWDLRPRPPAVREESNPLPLVWYAEDELHLAEVVVELPGVESFVAVGTGAIVRRDAGEVLRVDRSGEVAAVDDPPALLDTPPVAPRQALIGPDDVVLQAAPLADGGWAYVVHSGRADSGELRISDAGQRVLLLCDEWGRCREGDTGVRNAEGVRVR